MPMYLVFPNIAYAWDKIFYCQKETGMEAFQKITLPSVARARIEEEALN